MESSSNQLDELVKRYSQIIEFLQGKSPKPKTFLTDSMKRRG